MKIPTVKMTVPVFSEREYAPTSVSVNPEQEIDVKIREREVSLEYAAFLMNEKSLEGWYILSRNAYIDELFEAFVETPFGNSLLDSLTGDVFTEESAIGLIKHSLNTMLDNAIENDNTSTLDWI